MINFRYHVVSLTAVFLALVIGVAMGSTVISKATVDGLRSNVKRVETRIDSTQAQNSLLRSRLSAFQQQNNELTDQIVSRTVADSLTDVPVLMIASKGIDQTSLNQARSTLLDAGARFDGTLLVNDRLALSGASGQRARPRRPRTGPRRRPPPPRTRPPGPRPRRRARPRPPPRSRRHRA